MKLHTAAAWGAALAMSSASALATVTYDTWSSNAAPNGNYQFTVDHNAISSTFNYNLTVNPWNAEALGLFIDFGNVSISGPVTLTNVSPAGQVALHALETTSNTCGEGCNLSGLNPPLGGDGQWELVFRLGSQGFDSIQTFSWTTQDFGLDESDFGLVGIRAQQLCRTGTLPYTNCGDSDKVYGYPERTTKVPEPDTVLLIAIGLLSATIVRRQRNARTGARSK